MDEITPELIASIATRLFRESQAASAPLNGFAAPAEVPSGLPMPAAPPASLAHERFGRSHATPQAAIPEAVHGFKPGTAGMSTPSVPSELPKGFSSSLPAAGVPFGQTSTAASPAAPTDGLRAFVERIRSGESLKGSGLCPEDNFLARFKKIAAAPSPPKEAKTSYASRPLDVAAIRRDFPILQQHIHGKPLAWLDNAATTQKPQAVIDALSTFYSRDNSNIHRAAHTLAARATDAYEGAGKRCKTSSAPPR